MQRWKHAGRGPKFTLIVGILLGVASLVLNQNAYAQSQFGYPGNPATPSIPTGPSLGCTPSGMSNASWVCGFNPLTTVKFLVDGRGAGAAQSDSNGCVLVVITFLAGEVQIDNNAPVPVRHGQNFVTIVGHKSESAGLTKVGLRLPFSTPVGDNNQCAATPSGPGSGTSFPTRPTSSTFPIETTAHGFYPTTLAKAIETPLIISPNRVILVTSLLAAVLAAMLSAGALGAMWSAGGSARESTGAAITAGAASPAAGPPDGTGAPGPSAPEPGGPPGPGGAPDAPSSAPSVARQTSAFSRPDASELGGGGGG
jgi:hypothetical protein